MFKGQFYDKQDKSCILHKVVVANEFISHTIESNKI